MATHHSIPGTTPLACKFYNIMRTSIGLSDHAPADLQSPESGTLTRFSAGKTGIHTQKTVPAFYPAGTAYFLSFIRYFLLFKILYQPHPVGGIIFAALDLAGQVDAGGLP